MNISNQSQLKSFSNYAPSLLNDSIISTLTAQQKKVIAIATFVIGLVGVCLASLIHYKRMRSKKFAEKIQKMEDSFAQSKANIEKCEKESKAQDEKYNLAMAKFESEAAEIISKLRLQKKIEVEKDNEDPAIAVAKLESEIVEINIDVAKETEVEKDKAEASKDKGNLGNDSKLNEKYKIKIINATEYPDLQEAIKQIRVKKLNINCQYLDKNDFLAIKKDDHTVVGLLKGQADPDLFCVGNVSNSLFINHDFKNSQEKLEKRLILQAMEKAKQIGIKTFQLLVPNFNNENFRQQIDLFDEGFKKLHVEVSSYEEDGDMWIDYDLTNFQLEAALTALD